MAGTEERQRNQLSVHLKTSAQKKNWKSEKEILMRGAQNFKGCNSRFYFGVGFGVKNKIKIKFKPVCLGKGGVLIVTSGTDNLLHRRLRK